MRLWREVKEIAKTQEWGHDRDISRTASGSQQKTKKGAITTSHRTIIETSAMQSKLSASN
jgi:hypothetical protein